MATQPHPQPKPTPPPPSPPRPPNQPPAAKAEADHDPRLPIGAKPLNDKDPQAVKFAPPQPAPPRWEADPNAPGPEPIAWEPKAAIDPREEKPPKNVYADGMDIATEQRARAAWVESHGEDKYIAATDDRPVAERPVFQKDALAGGGAFVAAGTQKQVPGVVPPTKRE